MNWFENYRRAVKEAYGNDLSNVATPSKPIEPAEEWIWINGYKGTDRDMKCRGYQFELNKCFDISDDKKVELCEHGFHLCAKLSKVYNYYGIGEGNRFFEVKALVRKKDYDALGPRYYIDVYGYKTRGGENDKLAAKSIIFTRELTIDEILGNRYSDWTDEQKKLAIEIGVKEADKKNKFDTLVSLGYSETFAQLCIDIGKYDIAKAVGSQEGLSMDMKVYVIFNGIKK